MPRPARKGLDQQGLGFRDGAAEVLKLQPLLHVGRQDAPVVAVLHHAPHPLGQGGAQREFRTAVGRNARILVHGGRDQGVGADDALKGPDLAGEDEGVARRHLFEIPLLGLADLAPADQVLAARAPPGDAHVQVGGRDDGADVHPVALGHLGVADGPLAVAGAHDAGETVIGAQRIAAGGDQIDHLLERLIGQAAIGTGARHLGV
ncbi:hypothetical protein D3C77_304680 [compost metagenome]